MSNSDFKIGPAFLVNGNKKMMAMTPPISVFEFGIDGIINDVKNFNKQDDSLAFSRLLNITYNSLIAEILLYAQNRIGLMLGKSKISITSIPSVKSIIKKHFNVEIKTIIGDKGYKILKKLDRTRGEQQHSNDRYLTGFKTDKKSINTKDELLKYIKKIVKIIHELENGLDNIKKIYDVKIQNNKNQTIITTKAIGHSFNFNKMDINKKPPISEQF